MKWHWFRKVGAVLGRDTVLERDTGFVKQAFVLERDTAFVKWHLL